jgi:general secretion pathway protein G
MFGQGTVTRTRTRNQEVNPELDYLRMPKRWIDRVVGVTVILLLSALAIAGISGTGNSKADVRTPSLMKMLEAACKSYRVDYGCFPPGDPSFDSRVLHRALGSPRGAKPPIIDFGPEQLLGHPQHPSADRPLPIVDSWDRPLRYACPGVHGKTSFDLWSAGADGKDGTDDDVTNWNKEH